MDRIEMEVTERRALTPQIAEFTLAPVEGGPLPAFTAGAHVTVETPSGAMRRYSLVNDGRAPDAYVIAVKHEAQGRGGSASMHEEAQIGCRLQVEPPENDFGLAEAPDYLLIAGGIGITPIRAMAAELERQGKPFRIIYCTRSPEETAYAEELAAYGDRLVLHHDAGDPAQLYDFWDHFAEPGRTGVYCCGPKALMEEIEAVSGHWDEGRVRFEDFKPAQVTRADDRAFVVELRRSGRTVEVPADRSILEALRAAGVPTVSSCESGTCGTCRTRLLEGEADHRDMVLTEEERQDQVMICISRACGERLVLDL